MPSGKSEKTKFWSPITLLAGRVSLPAAALWRSSSQKLPFAEWLLRRKPTGWSGSACVSPFFEFVATKLPLEFRFLEAASRHGVLPTQTRLPSFSEAAIQPSSVFRATPPTSGR